jgi:flagellar basal body-associated protein FliL
MSEQAPKQGNKLGVVVVLLFLAAVGLGYMFIQTNAENEKLVQEKNCATKR